MEKPLGDNALFSILGSYNQSLLNQSDAAGGATTAQEMLFGKQFGAVTAAQATNLGYANARLDWNWQNKTTDFEMARLQWDMTPNLHLDNKFYTFFYKNFTVSTEDSTTPCGPSLNSCPGATPGVLVFNPGAKAGQTGGTVVPGDIAGYTKLNQYRDWGNVLQLDWKNPLGVLKVGAWFEHSASHRYRYDYDFTKASQVGAISQYHFDFAQMAGFFNYKETDKAANVMLNGAAVPGYISYDEVTSWDQIQGFGEFDIKALHDTLTITPGVKVTEFTRRIDTPIAAQKVRLGLYTQDSYKPVLPYATVNWRFIPALAAYAQFAKGFIMPSLGNSFELKGATVPNQPFAGVPTKTTNYQAGFVYAGERLNIDADVYYIEASSSTSIDPANPSNVIQNLAPAHYKGVEAQVSYVVVPGLTAIANGTLMSAKDTTSGRWLANAPNYTALLGAVYNRGRFKLSYLHKFTGRQFSDGSNVARIAPYSYGIASGSVTLGRVEVGVTVNNPWNDRSVLVQSGGAVKASTLYIYDAPASYQASVKVRF